MGFLRGNSILDDLRSYGNPVLRQYVAVFICAEEDTAREYWAQETLRRMSDLTSGAMLTEAEGYWRATDEFEDCLVVLGWTTNVDTLLAHLIPTLAHYMRAECQDGLGLEIKSQSTDGSQIHELMVLSAERLEEVEAKLELAGVPRLERIFN